MANAPFPAPSVDRIPVCLLTGFLGAGKTTLLNHLTHRPGMEGTAVLVNEFGEVGIDHHLVEAVDDSILLLDSGCLCCTMHGDFVKALRSLHERASRRDIPPIRRVIIETTGLADPVPVIYTLMEERYIAARFVCDSVLTMVDASRGRTELEPHREAVRQILVADRLLISKTDLSDRSKTDALHDWLDILNPAAPRLYTTKGGIEPEHLFSSGIYAPSTRAADVSSWLGNDAGQQHYHHSHGDAVTSFTVGFQQPVSWRGLSAVMGRILQNYGARLLRVKGVVNVTGISEPMVVQCVQAVAYPPVRLRRWPADGVLSDRQGRLVFIAQGLSTDDQQDIEDRLSALPSDEAAMRVLATTPLLPTRCWLNERLPWMGRGSFETSGWVVQPPIKTTKPTATSHTR